MKLLRGIVVALLLVSLAWAADGLVIKAVMPADQTQGTSDLGSLNVEGVGTVTLMAQRTGTRIVIQALAPDGKVIGQAESVIGPKETLIYVTTPGGLKKLTILWYSSSQYITRKQGMPHDGGIPCLRVSIT